MRIVIFTPAYPGVHDTSHYAFVKQLVDAMAEKGNECHVVVPYNVLHYKKVVSNKEEYFAGNGKVTVYRPYYLSFSGVKLLQKLSAASRKRALKRAVSQLPEKIDSVYCHFWNSGYVGYLFAKGKGLPLFVATGESDISKMFVMPPDVNDFRDYIKGVICVSSKNRAESIKLGLATEEKCRVFPNAVNEGLFYKKEKYVCRKQLGLPQDAFIVAFVGWFNERKGSKRVSEALKRISGVKSIFIGKGDSEPDCEGILFKGYLPHEDVPRYLSAADCFVLPTLAEGCCNAVVEAMACGLPVISSNLPFNWDVLDETNSILVDPLNVEEIASAISRLCDDALLRDKLAEGALQKAGSLTIEKRASAILNFMESKI